MNLVNRSDLETLRKYVFAVYILQALSFVTLISGVFAVMINYIKYDDIRETWLQSHFDWQKSTFWWALLWTLVGVVTTWIFVGWIILTILSFWLIYRIAKGWIYLVDGKEI